MSDSPENVVHHITTGEFCPLATKLLKYANTQHPRDETCRIGHWLKSLDERELEEFVVLLTGFNKEAMEAAGDDLLMLALLAYQLELFPQQADDSDVEKAGAVVAAIRQAAHQEYLLRRGEITVKAIASVLDMEKTKPALTQAGLEAIAQWRGKDEAMFEQASVRAIVALGVSDPRGAIDARRTR